MSRYLFCSANILCGLLLITGCGGDNDSPTEQKPTVSISSYAATEKIDTGSVDKTPWSGDAQGYVSSADPATDNVAFLVIAGRIQSALKAYREAGQRLTSLAQNNSATPELRELEKAIATDSVNAEIQSSYELIEPVLIKNKSKTFKDELTDLAKPETIANLLDTAFEKDKERSTVQKTVKVILSRLQTSINAVNPSIHEVMLATSALLRDAGEAMQKGLSAKGNIIDRQQYDKGMSLIYSMHSISPEYQVHYCDKSRDTNRDFKDKVRKLGDDLTSYTGKSSTANAGDVYAYAKEVEDIANSLPEKDKDICKQ